jgi:hypothetical protein
MVTSRSDRGGNLVLELEMGDADYDALLARLAATEAAHPSWKPEQSPTELVGAGVAGGDVEHSTPMLGLDNVFGSDELRRWAARLEKAGRPAGHGVHGRAEDRRSGRGRALRRREADPDPHPGRRARRRRRSPRRPAGRPACRRR